MDSFNAHHEMLNILLGIISIKSIFYMVQIEKHKKIKSFKIIKLLYFFLWTTILTTWLSYSPQSTNTIFISLYSSCFLDIIEKALTKKFYYFAFIMFGLFVGGFYSLYGNSVLQKSMGILILIISQRLSIFENKVNSINISNHIVSFLISITLSRIDMKYREYLNNKINKIYQHIRLIDNKTSI